MTDATAEFFDELGRRGHEPLLGRVKSTMRFDLVYGKRTDHWLLIVDNGDLKVSHKKGAADAVLRTDKTLFDGIARGEVNALAAVLRGTLDVQGDPGVLVLFQRILPSPPKARNRPRSTQTRARSTRQRRKT